jgi:hypothetical protein
MMMRYLLSNKFNYKKFKEGKMEVAKLLAIAYAAPDKVKMTII